MMPVYWSFSGLKTFSGECGLAWLKGSVGTEAVAAGHARTRDAGGGPRLDAALWQRLDIAAPVAATIAAALHSRRLRRV